MDRDNEKVLYNVLFPIWLLVFFPSYLIVVILASSLVALLICKGLNKCDKPGLDNNDKA